MFCKNSAFFVAADKVRLAFLTGIATFLMNGAAFGDDEPFKEIFLHLGETYGMMAAYVAHCQDYDRDRYLQKLNEITEMAKEMGSYSIFGTAFLMSSLAHAEAFSKRSFLEKSKTCFEVRDSFNFAIEN